MKNRPAIGAAPLPQVAIEIIDNGLNLAWLSHLREGHQTNGVAPSRRLPSSIDNQQPKPCLALAPAGGLPD